MSLYSSITFPATPLGIAAATLVPGSQFIVRVEEDQMDLVLNFQGVFTGATGCTLNARFLVDTVATPALPVYSTTFLTGNTTQSANFSLHVSLAKGEHTVAMEYTAAVAAAAIDGAASDCRFSATRVSSAATLAHGVDSKVQGIY
jgi:hypothetical protein